MSALTLGIPSKGRLKQACDAWFGEAGLILEQSAGARGYLPKPFTGATLLDAVEHAMAR